jgi:hypothetical protein
MAPSNPGLGLVIIMLSGVLTASFPFPMKFSRAWRWENTWLVYATFALVIIPLSLALWAMPNLLSFYASILRGSFCFHFSSGLDGDRPGNFRTFDRESWDGNGLHNMVDVWPKIPGGPELVVCLSDHSRKFAVKISMLRSLSHEQPLSTLDDAADALRILMAAERSVSPPETMEKIHFE